MKTPQFWNTKNLIAYFLWPISLLYFLVHSFNFWRKNPQKISTPIICIGNLVAGGAGKTPVALAIGEVLRESGVNFAYLSSGYGGKVKDFTLVDQDHKAIDVGDEPLLLAKIASTFVAKNRVFGAKKISEMPEKKLILMDDGLQNSALKKDLVILVIDGKYGFGNGFFLPAGALREPIKSGIKKADVVVIVGEDRFNISDEFCANKKVLKAKIKIFDSEKFNQKSVLAFCGIGRPEKFFDSLKETGAKIVEKYSYADHHQYKESEIEQMLDSAKKNDLMLVTTQKDWVRLAPKHQNKIDYLKIKMEFEDLDYLKNQLISLSAGLIVQKNLKNNKLTNE
ncbi:MAG: tetraacyldisaccharide 4'-kinase [Rickettsiales bacterium]